MHQFSFFLLVTAFLARIIATPLPDAELGFEIPADINNFQAPRGNWAIDGVPPLQKPLRVCSGEISLCCFKVQEGSGKAKLTLGQEQKTCAELDDPAMNQWVNQHCGNPYSVLTCQELKTAYLSPNNGNLLCFSNCPNQLDEEKPPADSQNQPKAPNVPDLSPLFQQQPSPKIPDSNQGLLTTGDPVAFFGGTTEELWNY